MEENKELESVNAQEQKKVSTVNIQAIYTTLVLNWKWFVLSVVVCLAVAAIYLHFKIPVYQVSANMLINDAKNSASGGNSIRNAANLGTMVVTYGITNEMRLLQSHDLATRVVRKLKLYTSYKSDGDIADHELYDDRPLTIDIDSAHLDKLVAPINMIITRSGNKYHVEGTYSTSLDGRTINRQETFSRDLAQLPADINLSVGAISFTKNSPMQLGDGQSITVSITTPRKASYRYVGALLVGQQSRETSIATLTINDVIPQRAIDYLHELVVCYNEQSNEDKNEMAMRTEAFINDRIEKVDAELGSTEGAIEKYKRTNHILDAAGNGMDAMSNRMVLDQQFATNQIQLSLLKSVSDYISKTDNKYQTLPYNIGITDATVSGLIAKYNDMVMERKHLLVSASETSPTVVPLTTQLDATMNSIKQAIAQARRNMAIQHTGDVAQYNKYTNQLDQTPEQERILNQIGRQQEVKSGLYLMLLQKREENSISLAATADKARMLDEPQFGGKVSPRSSIIMLVALIIGLAIPSVILLIVQLLRYKIEGHDDVVRLTDLPILADVAVANESAKSKGDIVVHENRNNQMEEIFRSMRTNLQFMLPEGAKVVMFTSTTSGEGKTFNAANLAMSFALLGKRVILVGLDIRKPRLAETFVISDHHHGITSLLTHDHPTIEQIKGQILPSGINGNLDILLAGPIPPNPAELLARHSLDNIVSSLKELYDYILLDTAPVGLVTDTLQIGRVADATIYMCRADYTAKDSFELINGLNADKKLPNMSIVVNGIDMSKKKYGYYYGYGKYGKYGRYGHSYGYGKYKQYGRNYGSYGSYGHYNNSKYGDKNDTSVKR